MTIQTINLGNYANDGTGDDLRTAFSKVNANFAAIVGEVTIAGAVNIGAGIGVFAQRTAANLDFKSLTSTDNSVAITSTANTVNLQTVTALYKDPVPRLGANLGLAGHTVFGPGDVQTTVHGVDVMLVNSLLALLIDSNQLAVDLGTFLQPTGFETNLKGYTFDMGYFIDPAIANQLNFGNIAV